MACGLLSGATSEPWDGLAIRETESCGYTIVAACSGDADVSPCADGDGYACQVIVLLCVRRDVGQQRPFDGRQVTQSVGEYSGVTQS